MREPIHIGHLADCPAALPKVSGWLYRQWLRDCGYSRQQAADELRTRLHRGRLPIALVALDGVRPVGVTSLIELRGPAARQRICCLSGLYVLSAWRRRGIGRLLCQRAIEEAERLQQPSLGLYTRDREPYYARMGWRKVMDAVPPQTAERDTVAFMDLALDPYRGRLEFAGF